MAHNDPTPATLGYCNAIPLVPSDMLLVADFPLCHAIYVGGAGDIHCLVNADAGAEDVTFKAVPVGAVLPISPRALYATGTTATNLIGLF